jgi:methylenetetrahydrofolate dehydrogenase (NADP+)/methenyltetrahydrofolate cyclohydrolase
MRVDGKSIATAIFEDLKSKVKELTSKGITPHLAIILVGDDPASVAYVGQKEKRATEIGCEATIYNLSSNITQDELLSAIKKLNDDSSVHGIIVQRPLPEHINPDEINVATNPKKDIDAFHKNTKFNMPLAEAVIEILRSIGLNEAELKQKNVVVIGKGETGGGPVIDTLRSLGAEPLVIDSKTPNPADQYKNADVIISTVGKKGIIKSVDLRNGVVLVGVGMYKGEDGKLHADYEEEEIKEIASYYTPVPGGVGPVNVAMLLKNLVMATDQQS